MANRIIWSPRAASHLESICEFIAEDSPVYARIFARKIVSLVRSIPAYPQTGRIVPEYNDPGLQEPLGYARWENFQMAIRRAVEACETTGYNPEHHFCGVTKLITHGKGDY